MRRSLLVVLSLIVVVGAVWLGVHLRESRLQRQRSAGYQQVLRFYTGMFPLGATREQLEDQLRAHGAPYEQVGGFDATGTFSDLVKIGREPAPWYCNDYNIYIDFAFATADPKLNQTSKSESDILRSIEIKPWLEACL
jgi:hypothetical protein